MARRRRTAFLQVWCCAPLVAAGCGDESAGSTAAETSPPAVTATTTSQAANPSTTRSPNSPPEATMPTIDRPATPDPAKSTTSTTTTTSVSAPPVTPGTSSTPSNLEIATADVRARVGADMDVEVVIHEQVTWPNGGLGCPEPGMSYTQALVDGERIVLRAGGVDYEYHSGKNRPAFYCPPNRVTSPATGSYGDV